MSVICFKLFFYFKNYAKLLVNYKATYVSLAVLKSELSTNVLKESSCEPYCDIRPCFLIILQLRYLLSKKFLLDVKFAYLMIIKKFNKIVGTLHLTLMYSLQITPPSRFFRPFVAPPPPHYKCIFPHHSDIFRKVIFSLDTNRL